MESLSRLPHPDFRLKSKQASSPRSEEYPRGHEKRAMDAAALIQLPAPNSGDSALNGKYT
jgi:hypothetical protein